MKILYVDYLTISGHVGFHHIHVNSLLRLGHFVHIVGKKGCFPSFSNKSNLEESIIPDGYYKTYMFPQVSERFLGLLRLKWIFSHINFSNYDYVIFSAYDVLSLVFFRANGNIILINHSNVSQLDSKIKLFFTSLLPFEYIHIVLNDCMEKRLKELLPDRRVVLVPHGIITTPPICTPPSFLQRVSSFVICPVNANYDKVFLKEIFESKYLLDFLEEENIVLYLKKSQEIVSSCQMIRTIDSELTKSEYNYLLSHSIAVILPYNEKFKYRCSGIFFECVAYDVPVIATRLDDLIIFENKTNILFFNDVKELVERINYYKTNPIVSIDKEIFNPDLYWKKVIR